MTTKKPGPLLKRIEIIDALRGFALAGIVLVHFAEQFLAAPPPGDSMNNVVQGPFDQGIDLFINLFLRGKFFALFSLLFGLGFFIQMDRAARRGTDFRLRFLWRLTILLAIGYLHHLFYRGDILTVYALLGMLLVLFHRVSARWLLVLTTVLFLGLPRFIIYYWFGAGSIFSPIEFMTESPELHIYFDTLRNGSIWQVFASNAVQGILMKADVQFGLFSRGYLTFAFFLTGMMLGRLRFFENTDRYKIHLKKAVKWSFTGLILLIVIAVIIFSGQDFENDAGIDSWIAMIGLTMYDLFNLLTTVIIVAFFILLFLKPNFKKWVGYLIPYGRTALTNYFLQSVLGTALFYGWGLGLLGEIRHIQAILMAIVIISIQVLVSKWWLSKFRYGPLEWIWRVSTYGRIP